MRSDIRVWRTADYRAASARSEFGMGAIPTETFTIDGLSRDEAQALLQLLDDGWQARIMAVTLDDMRTKLRRVLAGDERPVAPTLAPIPDDKDMPF